MIWGFAAMAIPIIRLVVVVEAYYAFGFVSAFVITSTAVFMVREDVLRSRGIEPGSPEARSLRFAGLRGIKSVILVGGGALIVEDLMREWYGSKVLDRKKHPTTKKIFPVDFNAVGGLRLGRPEDAPRRGRGDRASHRGQ